MQFSELYGDALDVELGTADRSSLFTVARRKAAINHGQREFARLTDTGGAPCCVLVAAITLVDDTREYDLESTTAGEFVKLAKQGPEIVYTDAGGTIHYYAGADLTRTSIRELDLDEPSWKAGTKGTPTKYYTRSEGGSVLLGFNVPPAVGTDETWVCNVPYVALPVDLTNDADVPFTFSGDAMTSLTPWHRALVHFGAEYLEKLRKDKEAAAFQHQLALDLVADYLKSRTPINGSHVQMARNYRGERAQSLDSQRFA